MNANLKKTWKPNWGEGEIVVLAGAVKSSHAVLFGKFSPLLTSEKKKEEWEDVVRKVNSVTSSCERTVEEVKKRWTDTKTSVKKKEAFRKREASQTGGGPPPDVSFKGWELDVLSTIPPESINGIEGAVDTAESHTHHGNISKRPSSAAATLPEEEASTSAIIDESPVVVAQTIEAEDDGSLWTEIPPEPKKKKMRKQEDSSMAELFRLKERRLAIEEKRLAVQERTARALEMIASCLESRENSSLAVSPIIKFNY